MTPVFTGGAREILMDFGLKHTSQVNLLYGLAISLGIVFVDQIPNEITKQASTLLGKSLLFLILYVTVINTSWIHGLLFVVFVGLLLNQARYTKEGFVDEFSFKLIDTKKKWWVEQVFEENPTAIEDDKVRTSAIQDDNLQQPSSVQDTKSSIM